MIAAPLMALLATTTSAPLQGTVPLTGDFDAVSITVAPVHAFEPPDTTPAPPSTKEGPDTGPATRDEIVVTASRHRADDPLRQVNMASFALTETVDNAVMAPVAHAYERTTPKPIRTGLRNVFANLREPVAFANFLLQLKFGKAVETAGRFAINSTLGLAGVIDVARRCPFNLPRRPNGFSDTLGFYGVKPGPFLFMPLIGPTTLRDLVGGTVDGVASPLIIGGPFRNRAYIITSNIFRTLDRRAEMDEELRAARAQPDPYVAHRDRYLDRREARVRRLKGLIDAGTVVAETPYGRVDPSATAQTCPHGRAHQK
ncbi:MlaA family lipoprotein [Sphingomonas fuzhouensis]|uniref:MlaA family lipoprotein n=1 Tax=Sphingomonas fuzhouensis TaxID=3106033 RepID=UPI002AFE0CA3|nr:VacJ family lipoprotein [Sphingomonas sp. SGZ-02]